MERVIKFRVWDKESKVMATALMIWPNSPVCGLQYYHNGNITLSTTAEDCEVMQFTGLTDKNGVEIYEGDIYKGEHGVGGHYIVYFVNGSFCGGKSIEESTPLGFSYDEDINDLVSGAMDWMEVVGNIYETPCLLK